ncbi:MAG: YbgC/FadM family acyl-CoA thioesterase [Erythrobacter sp.]|uniref:YbgC/FadM family acyl-CoA thioesterase n=1 Tax=Erythrobacter sp. TaxID=1042 RepID=UPI003C78C5C6
MTRPTPPGGVLDGARHLYAVRVYYEDTDLSGITYHANYLRWFERARSDLLRMLDIDQRTAIENGEGAWAVAEVNLKYRRPARLDDDIVIATSCSNLGAASCRMEQVAMRVEGDDDNAGTETLCEASLKVGFLTPEGRPRRMPADWRTAFANFMNEKDG